MTGPEASPPEIHVIGAGVSGLAAAVTLAKAGRRVRLTDAAGHAGGRCRSFHDAAMGCRIDNGNHLLLSGNRAVMAYLRDIGAGDALTGPARAAFPFLDLQSGERWTLDLDPGRIPWWIFSPSRRVPESRPVDYLRALRLAWAGPDATVAGTLGADNVVFKRFWEPMAVAVLNTAADEGAASLLWPVIRETFGRGGAACRPLIARDGLSESFVEPALRFLAANNAEVRLGTRLRRIDFDDGRVQALDFGAGVESVANGTAVILAVPPAVAAELVAGLRVPGESRAIVNGHFRLTGDTGESAFIGLVGGVSQWLFVRGAVASVTVSAADALADEKSPKIAERLWHEVRQALDLGPAPLPAHRIVKERRATFAQTPGQVRLRPGAQTAWPNLLLAGDWTDTGLPATIEGSIRSGLKAADLARSLPSSA